MKIYYPESLPISSHRHEIIEAIKENSAVIIEGETGSGKSTQIPKMIHEALGQQSMFACTQPRRIAAVSIAARIAEECEVEPGTDVGHKIRFDDLTDSQTKIIICTDGILLQEIKFDAVLSRYDAVFVDEAHERSLRIDFLLGILKDIRRKRELQKMKPLKIIVASATLDTEKFARFFETDGHEYEKKSYNVPIFHISGRMFPVEIFHTPLSQNLYEEISDIVEKIHLSKKAGDILVFLPGQQEIMLTIQAIERLGFPDLHCLPLFSKLSMEEQTSIFNPHPGKRHVVVATNIAETSLTVPGITTVIDSGLAKMTDFDVKTGIGSLTAEKISQASAIQRSGRAGRIEPGVCYRLYSEEDFKRREFYSKPEIQRCDLADVVLQMILMQIPNIQHFEFMDPPDLAAFKQAFQTLRILGAIDKQQQLTSLGKTMAYLPLDPRISRMLLAAERYQCMEEVAVIASFLSVKDPFLRPSTDIDNADQARSYFEKLGMQKDQPAVFSHFPKDKKKVSHSKRAKKHYQPYFSDLLTYLAVWKKVFTITDDKSREQYCAENYLNFLALEETKSIYLQLIDTFIQFGGKEFRHYFQKKDSMLELENLVKPISESDHEGILKSIASGLIQNLCQRDYLGQYNSQKTGRIILHPGSLFFNKHPQWIIATEIIETTKLFARNVTEIDPEWFGEIFPNFQWEKRRVIAPRKNNFFMRGRKKSYPRRRR